MISLNGKCLLSREIPEKNSEELSRTGGCGGFRSKNVGKAQILRKLAAWVLGNSA